MTYEGIRSRLESYKTPESRKMYVEERDVGYLYNHYLEHVQLLLWEVDRLERLLDEAVTQMERDYESTPLDGRRALISKLRCSFPQVASPSEGAGK